jgi:hypothetical protein
MEDGTLPVNSQSGAAMESSTAFDETDIGSWDRRPVCNSSFLAKRWERKKRNLGPPGSISQEASAVITVQFDRGKRSIDRLLWATEPANVPQIRPDISFEHGTAVEPQPR